MFAYCLNNPVCYNDPTGDRAKIWPILFEDHDPGFIHRAVQAHIVGGSALRSELVLPGFGRADIYDPDTGEIWEIKYGGNSDEMKASRTEAAIDQVYRYVLFTEITLKPGHANAFGGSFVINCDNISYLITYDTPEAGVILYYVQQMKTYNTSPYLVKVPRSISLGQTANNEYAYALVGTVFALGCIGAMLACLQTDSNIQ